MSSNEKPKLYFQITMHTGRLQYDGNKAYACAQITLYRVDGSYYRGNDKVYNADSFAVLNFQANELEPESVYSKDPTAYQPSRFVYTDNRFAHFWMTGTELLDAKSLSDIQKHSKELSSLVTRIEKIAEKYNLRYVHKQCDFGLIVDSLVKLGIMQVTKDGYDLRIEDTKHGLVYR